MISANLCTKITFNSDDEKRIGTAGTVISEIRDAMVKAGAYTETEVNALDNTLNILNDILHGEVF